MGLELHGKADALVELPDVFVRLTSAEDGTPVEQAATILFVMNDESFSFEQTEMTELFSRAALTETDKAFLEALLHADALSVTLTRQQDTAAFDITNSADIAALQGVAQVLLDQEAWQYVDTMK